MMDCAQVTTDIKDQLGCLRVNPSAYRERIATLLSLTAAFGKGNLASNIPGFRVSKRILSKRQHVCGGSEWSIPRQ